MKKVSLSLLALVLFVNLCCEAQECDFIHLRTALVDNHENYYQLSRTFFPPVNNPPQFVEVTYNFTETSETQTWYWSDSISNFIHPPEVMQYMSLFFTKPHYFFSGSVQLVLPPVIIDGNTVSISECAKNLERMQLLTQRVS